MIGAGGATAPVPVQLSRRRPKAGPAPWFHLVDAATPQVLLLERSAIFEVAPSFFERLAAADPGAVAELAAVAAGHDASKLDELGPLPPLRAISLNIAQSCNLACSYCYADEGRFHGSARSMSTATARRAINHLFDGVDEGDRVTVGFIGGEPLLNRSALHDAVSYATRLADRRGVSVVFSITTNGTLLRPEDLDLFRSHPFAVTVSLDGGAPTHDRHRRDRHGDGSWSRAVERLRPLLAQPGRCRVVARATVTRDDLDVRGRVEALTDAGFPEVGVSPARTGPDPSLLLRSDDWARYLDGLVDAAEAELARLRRTPPPYAWRFANLGTSLVEIHRGTCRPLPCGSAYGYASVDVDGNYATCHRTIGDPRNAIGTADAIDDGARRSFLEARLVDRQEPCRTCWARYLCGGGCHAEVALAGRESCDMIRDWLDYCIRQYAIVRLELPELLMTTGAAR